MSSARSPSTVPGPTWPRVASSTATSYERVWLHGWQVLRDSGGPRATAVHEPVVELLLARAELVGEELAEEYLAAPVTSALLDDGSAAAHPTGQE